MTKFEEVFKVNVNDKTEKKGGLTYLSWAWAWSEFKKLYPNATYEVKKHDGLPYVKDEKVGYMVYTSVTADELTYEMWLPVIDSRNKAILQPTMYEINKTIMRCLTKNLAMFGLGLYIYAGEDLPEDEQVEQEKQAGAKKGSKTGDNPTADKSREKEKTVAQNRAMKAEGLTRSELVQVWGVKNPEETIAWFEKKFQIPFAEWDETAHEAARGVLEQQKKKRETETAKYREELKKAGGELPFNEVN
jgi:hypothetical protein